MTVSAPFESLLTKIGGVLLVVSTSILLTSCPGPGQPKEPKPDIENVTITVLDRFDQPIPNFSLEMKRPYSRPMSLQTFEFVDRQRTDESGIAKFPLVKEDDWITESSEDGFRYKGTVTMEEGLTEYILKIDQAKISSNGYARDVNGSEYEERVEQINESLNRILSYYVEQRHTEFLSLKAYVDQGVIKRPEANRILRLAHRMNDSTSGINFGWGAFHLRIADYESPITWVESH